MPNLAVVQTVDSKKLANKLETAVESSGRELLRVYVQVNTSGEDQKAGVPPSEVATLANHIITNCPHLRIDGVMTIGAAGVDPAPFFTCLADARIEIAAVVGVQPNELALSMGMSADFEQAIQAGATHVRVGSSIFGARPPKHTPDTTATPTISDTHGGASDLTPTPVPQP